MIRKRTLMVLALASLSTLACSRDREVMTPASRVVMPAGQESAAEDPRGELSDGQIAGILVAASSAEIQQGGIAQRRAQRQEVRDFATMMVMEHSKALEEIQVLATKAGFGTASSEVTSDLRSDNQGTVSALSEAKAADFDEEYVEARIEAHEGVLKLLDDELIPNAVNPELRSSLLATRPAVAAHLERARNLERLLQ